MVELNGATHVWTRLLPLKSQNKVASGQKVDSFEFKSVFALLSR